MKIRHLLILLIFLLVIPAFGSCSSAEKAAVQRRNLMMPEKSDLPRNSKYRAPGKRKTYKPKKKKKRKYGCIYLIHSDEIQQA